MERDFAEAEGLCLMISGWAFPIIKTTIHVALRKTQSPHDTYTAESSAMQQCPAWTGAGEQLRPAAPRAPAQWPRPQPRPRDHRPGSVQPVENIIFGRFHLLRAAQNPQCDLTSENSPNLKRETHEAAWRWRWRWRS